MTEASTPLMRQYQSIKKRYPHALVLFRLGDFYELFYEDAIVAARELQITLDLAQPREGRAHPDVRRALPRRRDYIARLLRAGYKIAVCDQMEAARPRQKTGAPRSGSRHHARHGHRPASPRAQGE